MKILALAVVLVCLCRMAAGAESWKPAKSPLMTRWAKDVDPANVHAEYPRPQMERKEWRNLNGLWQFSSAEEVKDAPHGKDLAGQILVPFCMESALSGVGKHHDKSWYRRTFEVPKEWRDGGKRVLLHFGAVDYESTVWVNGKELGKHVGGYDGFSYDITDALKADGEQEVVVGVTDVTADTQARGKQIMNPHGIWYTPVSGIWQTVWIEPVGERGIESVTIVPVVDEQRANIIVRVDGRTSRGIALHHGASAVAVVTQGGAPVATIEDPGKGGPSDSMLLGFDVRIPQDKLKLWSPDSPTLYDVEIRLFREGREIDRITSYFGMRKIEISPDEKGVLRIKLNAKEIMQVGPLDQGFWPDGLYTAPTEAAMVYDLEVTKKLGFNMVRKHVKVEPQRWYYHADKMGLLVWQDMPNAMSGERGEWQKQFEKEVEQLVKQHINSPAIVMWVPLNEGWGQDGRKKEDGTFAPAPYDKDGTARLAEMVKKLDPTRLVNSASGWTDHRVGDVHDIHNYPGPAAPPIEKQRAIVLGEFGGLGLPVEGHLWQSDKNWGYQNMISKEELTDRYVRLLGRLWQLHDEGGLCAGVYTQTTDVEGEVNGLLTYDREVLKVDEARTREANLGKGPRVDVATLIKTAQDEPAEWKYTTENPGDGWEKAGYDDSKWKTGKSGFGAGETPGAVINTPWTSSEIWLRREIDVPADAVKDAEFIWRHDEAGVIFINGVRAARSGQHTTGYVEQRMSKEGREALKPGKNVIAVRCTQTTGGQYIDVGMIRLVEKTAAK